MFDLLVSLANDHGTMKGRSEDEQTLIRIQHEWAEARVKGDSSYARRIEADDCTIVWPEGRIVNKRQDLLGGKFVWTDTFVKQSGQWKVLASQITPVLEK
jgi:hypothetical protein